jgi:hypothetical protein
LGFHRELWEDEGSISRGSFRVRTGGWKVAEAGTGRTLKRPEAEEENA